MYTLNSKEVVVYGTTQSDIDSSDAILSEVEAPETVAGLNTNNSKITPASGADNTFTRKWGSFIFYPYSLNTDTNNFKESSNVRYDNASSTYGSIGGLLLANSARGMGLPSTVGSTFLVDETTIPRTLNPDCNMYLSYTVACESSLKKATFLPRKLTNGYLVILSSMIKEPNFYMATAGWVNAIATVSKAFITGDFILSQGDMQFYAKEDLVLSQITTEIKDTAFNAPTTLGINSAVIYSITDYNPKPERQLPTIAQQQETDMQLQQMVQNHMQMARAGKASPLDNLMSDFSQLGLDVLTMHNKATGDLVSALTNQIQYHDLASLTPHELTQFYQTPEGLQMIQNAGEMTRIHQMSNDLSGTYQDLESPNMNAQTLRRLQMERRQLEGQISEAHERVSSSVPSMFFRPSEPVESLIPPLMSLHDVNTKQVSTPDFIKSGVDDLFYLLNIDNGFGFNMSASRGLSIQGSDLNTTA